MAAGSILQVHLLFTFACLNFDDIRSLQGLQALDTLGAFGQNTFGIFAHFGRKSGVCRKSRNLQYGRTYGTDGNIVLNALLDVR